MSAGDSSPTEEELEAAKREFLVALELQLAEARESARVAMRERDEARRDMREHADEDCALEIHQLTQRIAGTETKGTRESMIESLRAAEIATADSRMIEAMKASCIDKCDHLARLVIDDENGQRICCECWAERAEAQLTDRDRMIAGLREALRMSADRRHRADCDITTAFDNPNASHNTTACCEAAEALSTSHPIAAAYEAQVVREWGESPRCKVTGNLCGTDTWMEHHPCPCGACQEWLCRTLDAAQARLRAHEETIGRLSHALQNLHDESLLGTEACISCGAKENGSARSRLIKARIAARHALTAAPPGEYEQRIREEGRQAGIIEAGKAHIEAIQALAVQHTEKLEAIERVIADASDVTTGGGTMILGAVGKSELLAAIRALASKEEE